MDELLRFTSLNPETLREYFLSFMDLRTLEEEVVIHGGIIEFYNECHLPAGPGGGQFGPKGSCPGTGLTGRLKDEDGKASVTSDKPPVPRDSRGYSLVDPNEGTREIDGLRGYDAKGKPIPGTDAWLEAHNISKEVFEQRPYVRFEADKTDQGLLDTHADYPRALAFWKQRAEQEGQTGGYVMTKTPAPGTIEKPPHIAPQVRPNLAVVANPGERAYREKIMNNAKADLDALKNTTKSEFIKQRKTELKKAELHLERVQKATKESIRADAEKTLSDAKSALVKAKASGDEGAIVEADTAHKQAKRNYDAEMKRARNWEETRQVREIYAAKKNIENAQNRLENAQKDPEKYLNSAIKNQELIVKQATHRWEKTANKYIFPKGEKVARIDVGGDKQNLENLKGKGRLYFAMEGAIKHDAIQTAIKREDPTAAVVNVPSVTLWDGKNSDGDDFDPDDDGPSETIGELAWFTKKYGRNREIILIPDADGVKNPNVTQQADAMATALSNAGADPKKIYLAAPPLRKGTTKQVEKFKLPSGADEERKGIDDHLGAGRGTLGQLQYKKTSYDVNHDLSEYTKASGGVDGVAWNKNSIERTEKVLNAISGIVGPKGVARISKKMLAQASDLSLSSAYDARERLRDAGIISLEYVYDPEGLTRRERIRNPNMSEDRYNELVRNNIIKPVNFDEKYMKSDLDQSPIITINNPKYLVKDSDITYGSLQELDTWKPPKSFDGWRSPVTGKKDTTGLAKSVQETSLYNSRRAKRAGTKKITNRVEVPGVRYVRSAAGAKLYGVPIGYPIPKGVDLKGLAGEDGVELPESGIISMTMGSMNLTTKVEVVEPDLMSFYNKCHDEDDGQFCEGDDGPSSLKTDPSWPKRRGRKVTSRPGEAGDEVKADKVFETETANGAKIRLYDKTGEVKGEKAEQLLNNHARMHEMYPMNPPRSIVVEKPGLFRKTSIQNNQDVSLVNSLSPYTYVNANNIDYDTKSFRTGWGMHSSQTGNTKNMDYILTHEYGHHVDFQRNSDGYTHRPNAIFRNPAMAGTLSRYGRQNDMEAYAETFAEWHHTDGRTKNPATVAMARDQGWYGSTRRASAEMEQEQPSILSFQVDEELEVPSDGITVIDNWEDGPEAINYKAKEPTPEEVEAANKLAKEVFEELGLDYEGGE